MPGPSRGQAQQNVTKARKSFLADTGLARRDRRQIEKQIDFGGALWCTVVWDSMGSSIFQRRHNRMLKSSHSNSAALIMSAVPALWLIGFTFSLCTTRDWPQNRVAAATSDPKVVELAREVRTKGWIVYSVKTQAGDWDLFLMRPDGSSRRNITHTTSFNEVAARFSPDGQRLLYYRQPLGSKVDNNGYGMHELIIGDSDGTNPVVYGNGYPWASWGAGGKQIACFGKSSVQIVDLSTRKVIKEIDRKGVFEQLFWSPDGKWLCGTANGLGQYWTIARMNAATGEVNLVSDPQCYNCTADWFPDSQHIIYSNGIPCTNEWAQLWMASGDGKERRMIYGETGRHIYGGAVSPDAQYVLFTKSRRDLGKVDNSATTIALMRLRDAPAIGGTSAVLRKEHPDVHDAPVLDLSNGWEPHWTYARIGQKK
jgi:WD40-like Beta Propeller Repeat